MPHETKDFQEPILTPASAYPSEYKMHLCVFHALSKVVRCLGRSAKFFVQGDPSTLAREMDVKLHVQRYLTTALWQSSSAYTRGQRVLNQAPRARNASEGKGILARVFPSRTNKRTSATPSRHWDASVQPGARRRHNKQMERGSRTAVASAHPTG